MAVATLWDQRLGVAKAWFRQLLMSRLTTTAANAAVVARTVSCWISPRGGHATRVGVLPREKKGSGEVRRTGEVQRTEADGVR